MGSSFSAPKARIADDHLPIIAAGVAFYGLRAIFPALAALVAVYGLMLDPQQVTRQVEAMQGVLPAQAVQLLVAQLRDLTASDRNSLSVGAAGALVLALWSASAGIRTLMKALNESILMPNTVRWRHSKSRLGKPP